MVFSRLLKTKQALELTNRQKKARVGKRIGAYFTFISILVIVAGILCYTVWANNETINTWFAEYGNWVNNTPMVQDVYHWLGTNLHLSSFDTAIISNQASASLLLVSVGIVSTLFFSLIYGVSAKCYNKDKKIANRRAARLQRKLQKLEYKQYKRVERKLAKRNK